MEGQDGNCISHVYVSFVTLLKFSKGKKLEKFKDLKNIIEQETKEIIDTIPVCYKVAVYLNPSLRNKCLTENEQKAIKEWIMSEYEYVELEKKNTNGIDRLNEIFHSDSSDDDSSWEEFSKYEKMIWTKDIYSDPVDFWKNQEKYLPNLSLIAKDYLCISSSSANIERLWSKAEKVVTPSRSKLKPENVENIFIVMSNMDFFSIC